MSPKKKVLYFIAGPVPTEAQNIALEKLNTRLQTAVFRNAEQLRKDDALEKCDLVAGQVPEGFYAKTPRADEPELPLTEGGNEPVALDETATVVQIKDALAAKGIEIPAGRQTKADLLALLNA